MGVLTNIRTEYDDDAEEIKIYATTRFAINSRSTLNRIAGRAAVGDGTGQRHLVAAAYDKLGIDLVFNEGLGVTKKPEEKFPEAQKIQFEQYSIETVRAGDGILAQLPGSLQDTIKFNKFSPEATLYIWTIPYEVSTFNF